MASTVLLQVGKNIVPRCSGISEPAYTQASAGEVESILLNGYDGLQILLTLALELPRGPS